MHREYNARHLMHTQKEQEHNAPVHNAPVLYFIPSRFILIFPIMSIANHNIYNDPIKR